MGTVVMHNVVSVDGFIADENDDPGPLHEWYFSGDTPIGAGGTDRGSIIPESVAVSRYPTHRRRTSGRCGTHSARLSWAADCST
jgi:hypothetical protein